MRAGVRASSPPRPPGEGRGEGVLTPSPVSALRDNLGEGGVRASPLPRGIIAAPTPHGDPIVRKLTRDLRYLLNTTAAVLCVLIVAVWVASYFRYDGIESGTIRRPNIPGGDFVWQNWIVKYLEGRFYLEIVTVSDPSKETIASRPLGLDWHGGSWMEDDSIRVLFGLPATTHFSWSHYWFQVDTQTRTPFCLLDDHGYLVSVRTYQRRLIVIPLWALLLPPLVWTIFVLRTYRRTRRRSASNSVVTAGASVGRSSGKGDIFPLTSILRQSPLRQSQQSPHQPLQTKQSAYADHQPPEP